MKIPNWYEALLLALAAWRIFQLLAFDDILDRPRRYVTRLGKTWQQDGDPIPSGYRKPLGDFLTCPYCFGFWIALAVWGLWQIWPHGVLIASVPFALSAALIGAAKLLGPQ